MPLKARAGSFFSLYCASHTNVGMNITFEILSEEHFDDLVFCIFVNTLFSPLQGTNCLFWIFCHWFFLSVPVFAVADLRQVLLKAFVSHSSISCRVTSELILSAFCKQLLLPLEASADFFLLSLWREWGFAWELYLVSEVTQRLYLQLQKKEQGAVRHHA